MTMPGETVKVVKCEHCGQSLLEVLYFERGRLVLNSKTAPHTPEDVLYRCPNCRNVVPVKDVEKVL